MRVIYVSGYCLSLTKDVKCTAALSRLLSLHTSGECGTEWLIAIIDDLNKVQQRLGLRGKKESTESKEAKETHQAQQEDRDHDRDADCWRCGKGHPADQCWSKELKCHGCNQKGHIKLQCTKITEFRSKRSEKKSKGAGKCKNKDG